MPFETFDGFSFVLAAHPDQTEAANQRSIPIGGHVVDRFSALLRDAHHLFEMKERPASIKTLSCVSVRGNL
jgi:hypothetical protein